MYIFEASYITRAYDQRIMMCGTIIIDDFDGVGRH